MLISTNDEGGQDEVSQTSAVLILTINVGLDETITLISLCPCTAVHQETRGVDEPTGSGRKPQYLLVEWTCAWDRSVVGSTRPRLVLSPTDRAAQDEFSLDVSNMPVYVLLEPNPACGRVFAREMLRNFHSHDLSFPIPNPTASPRKKIRAWWGGEKAKGLHGGRESNVGEFWTLLSLLQYQYHHVSGQRFVTLSDPDKQGASRQCRRFSSI